MWLVFIILLCLYLLVKIIKTILDIWDFFRIRKNDKEMAEIWESTLEEDCECCQEETEEIHKGKHSL